MSIYRARLRNTSNALSPRVSSERLQVPPKLFGVDSWIPQFAPKKTKVTTDVLAKYWHNNKLYFKCVMYKHLPSFTTLSLSVSRFSIESQRRFCIEHRLIFASV